MQQAQSICTWGSEDDVRRSTVSRSARNATVLSFPFLHFTEFAHGDQNLITNHFVCGLIALLSRVYHYSHSH